VEEPHFLEAPERAIQRPVGGQDATSGSVGQIFRDVVAVELDDPITLDVGCCEKDRLFEGHEAAGIPSHGTI